MNSILPLTVVVAPIILGAAWAMIRLKYSDNEKPIERKEPTFSHKWQNTEVTRDPKEPTIGTV